MTRREDPGTAQGPGVSIEPIDPECARVRFPGTFRGAPILWEARVVTLARVQRERAAPRVRQFIEVVRVDGASGELHIGLPVPAIDRPAVLKTVTMVRQWRRLDHGRHEFGPERDYRRPVEPATG